MLLSVAERIQLLQIIPTKGDYVTLKILTQLRLNLGLTEAEIKDWEVVMEENLVSWAENGVAELPIGEIAMGIIVDALRKLDREKELPVELLDTYEKFIPTTE